MITLKKYCENVNTMYVISKIFQRQIEMFHNFFEETVKHTIYINNEFLFRRDTYFGKIALSVP